MSWIAIRTDLPGDPSTIATANELGVTVNETLGLLLRLWFWADAQLVDGYAAGVTFSNIDDIVGVTGFAQALSNAGWLEQNGTGVVIPNFDNWMSKSAKNRLKTAKRMKKMRDDKNVTSSSPHNITEQVVKKSTSLLSLKQAETIYACYPKQTGKKAAIKAIIKALKEKPYEELLEATAKFEMEVAGTKGTEQWQFVKHPATWFNQGCWDDETTPPLQIAKPPGRVQSRPGKYAGR